MAFIAQDPNEQQDQNNQQQGQQTAGQGAVTGQGVTIGNTNGTNQTGGGTSTGASSATNNPKGTSSGSFTNLQNYVTANQGNDTQMGQQVQGMVQGAADKADQAGQQFQQNANNTIGSQVVNEDTGLTSRLRSGDTSGVDQDSFTKQYKAAYGGPDSAENFAGYGNTNKTYQNVDTYGQEAAGDSAAHQQLLQDTYARNGHQYNQEEQNLDAYVLGTGQGGAQALQNINQNYGNYSQNFQNIAGLINQGVAQAKATDAQTAQDVQQAAQQGFGTLQNRLDAAAHQAELANVGEGNLNNRLAYGDPDSLRSQGLTDAAIKYIQQQGGKNFNWANLENQMSGRHTVGDFADANDVGNYQNLMSLVNRAAPGALAAKYAPDQLTASNATGPSLKAADVNAANQLADLNTSLQQSLGSRQYEAAQQYADLQRDLKSIAGTSNRAEVSTLSKILGVDPTQLYALTFKEPGLDPSSFLKGPGRFGLGDIASRSQAAQFAQLSNLLGLNPNLNTTGAKNFTVDQGTLQALANQAAAAQEAQNAAIMAQTSPDNSNQSSNGNPLDFLKLPSMG